MYSLRKKPDYFGGNIQSPNQILYLYQHLHESYDDRQLSAPLQWRRVHEKNGYQIINDQQSALHQILIPNDMVTGSEGF